MISFLVPIAILGVGIYAWRTSRSPEMDEFIAIAKKYVGTQEEPPGTNSGPVVDLFTGGFAAPWCAYFVSYVIREAGIASSTLASVQTIAERAKAAGVWTKTPSVGAVLILLKTDADLDGVDKGLNHTGIVVGTARDGRLVCVEGNYGNGVHLVSRRLSEISGFIPFEHLAKVWE